MLFYSTNILKWREVSDTYLTNVCRHRWSTQITMKVDGLGVFSSCRGNQNSFGSCSLADCLFIAWWQRMTKITVFLTFIAWFVLTNKQLSPWLMPHSQGLSNNHYTEPSPLSICIQRYAPLITISRSVRCWNSGSLRLICRHFCTFSLYTFWNLSSLIQFH